MSSRQYTYKQAKDAVMPFGKHKGKTLEQIAEDDVLYLDWILGQKWLKGDLKACIQAVAEEYHDDIAELLDED